MPSFFTTFLEKFQKAVREKRSKGMDLGGRYLGLILQEVLLENPALVKVLLPEFQMKLKSGLPVEKFTVETEVAFRVDEKKRKRRSADLEVVYGDQRGFIEIKWEDIFLEGQLEDYIEYCSNQKMHFSILYLRPESFSGDEEAQIKGGLRDGGKIGFISCRELHKNLIDHDDNITCLFRSFLEDYIMEYQDSINRNALLAIMKTGLNWNHSDGLRKVMVTGNLDDVPDVWKTVLTNIKVVSNRIYDSITKADRNLVGNAPGIDFHFRPLIDAKSLQNKFEDGKPEYVTPSRYGHNTYDGEILLVHSEGGYFTINSRLNLKPDNLLLECGTFFYFLPGDRDETLHFGVSCNVWRKKENLSKYKERIIKKIPLTKSQKGILAIPKEDVVFSEIMKVTKEALNAFSADHPEVSPKTIEKVCAALS